MYMYVCVCVCIYCCIQTRLKKNTSTSCGSVRIPQIHALGTGERVHTHSMKHKSRHAALHQTTWNLQGLLWIVFRSSFIFHGAFVESMPQDRTPCRFSSVLQVLQCHWCQNRCSFGFLGSYITRCRAPQSRQCRSVIYRTECWQELSMQTSLLSCLVNGCTWVIDHLVLLFLPALKQGDLLAGCLN